MDIQRQRIYRGSRMSPCSAQMPPAGYCAAKPFSPQPVAGCSYPCLAMVYAPDQSFEGIYSPEKALQRGTLFEGLDLPIAIGKRCAT